MKSYKTDVQQLGVERQGLQQNAWCETDFIYVCMGEKIPPKCR